jgi:arylsulfatase A-like enzyme
MTSQQPNVVFVFGDQWRAQATGHHGNAQVQTPNIDALAERSINFSNAIAGCPVCSPYRASLMTGQYPHTHGVFLNDVHLSDDAESLGKQFARAGYRTGYIGKWHIDGRGRKNYIPPESRQGFEFWKVLECTHDYNNSQYYADDEQEVRTWEGYDAVSQTEEARRFIRESPDEENPFLLFLSWGPPHTPYHTAPQRYRDRYAAADIQLRPNVPEDRSDDAREMIAGYYAHCTALDDCIGRLMDTLAECGIGKDTIFVFTSDHGDMLCSHGQEKKQRPYEESVRVPFLLHYPRLGAREVDFQIDAQDIMPTLLNLCDLEVPDGVQGRDLSPLARGESVEHENEVVLSCYVPFGQWTRERGGRECRGIRTGRYTYVRTLDGPWLLFDNQEDPYQMENLVESPAHRELLQKLDARLDHLLERTGDEFLPADEYLSRWGYLVDQSRTTPTAAFPADIDRERYRLVEYWQGKEG